MMLGGLFDRGVRWAIKWYLSGALGPVGLGVYSAAMGWGQLITSFSPLGTDTGIIYFAARYKRSGELDRLKGALQVGLVVTIVLGAVSAGALWSAARFGPWWAADAEMDDAFRLSAPMILPWTILLYGVGTLKALKDMRRSTLAFQVTLPLLMLAATFLLVGVLDLGVQGAILGASVATALAMAQCLRFAWQAYGSILRDPAIVARRETAEILRFSIPQSLTAAAFQGTMQLDVLMLTALASMEQVGLYGVAASLASFGAVPANAIAGMLNPFIAELVYAGETARLNALLQTATRWLIVASVPVYLVLLLVPDVVLSIYDEAYAVSASSLVLLTAGQIVNTICAPAMRLIPMSGRSLLNLGNALAALALSALLCWFFIPRWGAWGASLATATSLTLWSSWRVVEVWWLLGCFPFDRRAGGLLALAATGWALVRWGVGPEHPLLRIGGTALVILVFLVVAFTAARSPEDEAVLGRVRAGLRRRLGRPAGKN